MITTKYEQLVTLIKQQVEDNMLAGTKLPTEAEWAKELKVNKTTLNKALAHLQREGYISRKTGVGTIVTYNEKHVVKNIVTAVLFPDLEFTRDTYYSVLLREISRQTLQADRMHSVVNIGNDDRQSINSARLEQLLRQSWLAGVIVAASRLGDEKIIMALAQQSGIPIIWIGVRIDHPRVNFIYTDNYSSTLELLAQAGKAGYTKIAFVSKTLNTWSRQERHRAFTEKQGSENVHIGEPHENAFQTGYNAMRRLLSAGWRPDCILAADKVTADGIRQAIAETDNAPPIPLLTFDYYFDDGRRDILASAVQPVETMAQQAVAYIVKQDFSKPLRVMFKNRILIEAGT